MLADFDLFFNDFTEKEHELIDTPIVNFFPFSHEYVKHSFLELEENCKIGVKQSCKLGDFSSQYLLVLVLIRAPHCLHFRSTPYHNTRLSKFFYNLTLIVVLWVLSSIQQWFVFYSLDLLLKCQIPKRVIYCKKSTETVVIY